MFCATGSGGSRAAKFVSSRITWGRCSARWTAHARRNAPRLTDRDKTILRCILQGLTNKEIGARIEISEGAVKASVRHVCEKLGVRTRSQLVKIALEQYKDQL